MKIQCNGCEVAEAKVFCCADEAALCLICDDKIHSSNKLVNKHQRVPLSTSSSSSSFPKCDICQETVGYFICLEDRALLCRKCDVSIHTVNSHVRGHQRFLLGGVRVGLESAGVINKEKLTLSKEDEVVAQGSTSRAEADFSVLPINISTTSSLESLKTSLNPCSATKNITDSSCKNILELLDSNNIPSCQGGLFEATETTAGFRNSEWWDILRSTEEQLQNDTIGTADDISWTVPHLLPDQYFISDYSSPREIPKVCSTNVVKNNSNSGNVAVVDDFQFCKSPINPKRRPKRKA